MGRIQLEKSAVVSDEMALVRTFIQAAYEQGFDVDWVEAIVTAAIANRYTDFWPVMLAHIEIISPRPERQQQLNR